MGQALYRKYRSKQLAEIVGQEHITHTLEHALAQHTISHAYLFTGPRGVGKTSIARILAHEINGLPYENDATHMDIIEIDAASNRRIDEIRDLREKVHIAPTSAQYKVYIIDEVHMLTKEAFNALLKTLEEPPAHVVFILATTDVHKLPDTIISRTQRYNFHPVEQQKVVDHLRWIADQESIRVDDEALALLADYGEGSFRDSISMLDQARNQSDEVSAITVQRLLGIPTESATNELVASIQEGSSLIRVTQQLNQLLLQGLQPAAIAKRISAALRSQLMEGSGKEAARILSLLEKLLNVPSAHDPARYLEIILLEVCVAAGGRADKKATATVPSPSRNSRQEPTHALEILPTVPEKTTPENETHSHVQAEDSKAETQDTVLAVPQATTTLDAAIWPQILESLKRKYNTLYGVVRMAEPTFLEDDQLELSFAFAFHQKRISDPKNQKIIGDVVKEISGRNVKIICTLDAERSTKVEPSSVTKPEPKTDDSIATINAIFGGGEVL